LFWLFFFFFSFGAAVTAKGEMVCRARRFFSPLPRNASLSSVLDKNDDDNQASGFDVCSVVSLCMFILCFPFLLSNPIVTFPIKWFCMMCIVSFHKKL